MELKRVMQDDSSVFREFAAIPRVQPSTLPDTLATLNKCTQETQVACCVPDYIDSNSSFYEDAEDGNSSVQVSEADDVSNTSKRAFLFLL